MKILVTGAAGFIGHNVVRFLEQQGHEIFGIDNRTNYGFIPQDELEYLFRERFKRVRTFPMVGDIRNDSDIRQRVGVFNIRTIVHLASFPRQKVVNKDPVAGSKTMSEGLLNLLELSKQNNVQKFVYISSSMVYGDFTNDVTEDAVCNPQGQYGIMKLAGEWLVKDYSRNSNMKHTILRPSAVYGPLDVEDRVISKFLLTAMRGGTLKVNGASELLDFTYVDDAADGIVASAVSNNTNNKTYNITKSHSRTLHDAAKLAVHIAGKGTIELLDKDNDFPSRGALNIDRAKNDFNFSPKVDVEEGFQIYYDWLKNSPFWSAKTIS